MWGPVALLSATDSTEQLVWCLLHMWSMVHVISVICYLMCICICTSYYCELVVGLRAQFYTLLEVCGGWELGCLTLDTETSLYAEDRGLQVLMVLEHDYIPHTYKCFFRSYGLLDWSTLILSGNKTHTHTGLNNKARAK
jgi:hypothetical protein